MTRSRQLAKTELCCVPYFTKTRRSHITNSMNTTDKPWHSGPDVNTGPNANNEPNAITGTVSDSGPNSYNSPIAVRGPKGTGPNANNRPFGAYERPKSTNRPNANKWPKSVNRPNATNGPKVNKGPISTSRPNSTKRPNADSIRPIDDIRPIGEIRSPKAKAGRGINSGPKNRTVAGQLKPLVAKEKTKPFQNAAFDSAKHIPMAKFIPQKPWSECDTDPARLRAVTPLVYPSRRKSKKSPVITLDADSVYEKYLNRYSPIKHSPTRSFSAENKGVENVSRNGAYRSPQYTSPVNPMIKYYVPDPTCFYNTGLDSRGVIPGLNTIHREVMDLHHAQLVDVMEPRQMTCALLGLGAIGDDHCLQLDLTYEEGLRAVNRLLLAFLRKQGTAGFIALVSALKRCYNDHLANMMLNTEARLCSLFFDRPVVSDIKRSCPDPWSSPSSSEIGEMQSKQNVQMPTKHSSRMENINRVANGDNDSPDDQPRRARRNDTSTLSASSALSVGTSADSIKAPKRRTKLKTKTNPCAEERARNLERAVAALEKQARDADKIRGEHLHRRVDSIERHFCQTGGRSTKDQVESTDNTLFPKNERFREKQARDTGKISTEQNGGRFGPLQESNITPRSSEDSAIRILEDRLDFLSKLILRGLSLFGESGPSEEGNMITRNILQPQEYAREYSNKRPSEHSAVRNLEDRLDFLKRFILGGLPHFGQQSHNADHASLNTFDGRACGSSLRNRLGSQTYGSPLLISLARTARNDKTGRPFGGNSADRLEERIDNLQTLITGTQRPDGASPESEHTKNLEERIRFLENCLIGDGRDLPRETEGEDLDNALKDRLDSVERKLRGTHSDMLGETSEQSPVRPVKDKVVSLENLVRASGKKIKGGPSEGYPSRNLADRVDSLERFADDMQTDEATSKDLEPDPEENLVKEMKKNIDNERKEDLENERKEALENTLKPKIDVLDYQIRGAHCGSSTSLDWQQRSRPAAERIRSLENLMGVPGKELAQEPSGTSPERNIQDEVQSLENLKGLTECVKDRLNALEANLHGTAKIFQGGTYHPIPDRPLTDRIASLEILLRDDDGQNEHNLNKSIPSRVDSLERMAGENGPMNNRVNRLENLLGGRQSGGSSDDTNAVKQPTPLTDRITSLEHAARTLGHAVKGGPSDGYPERTPAHRVKSLERIAEQLPLAASSPANKPKASAWPKFLFWSKPS